MINLESSYIFTLSKLMKFKFRCFQIWLLCYWEGFKFLLYFNIEGYKILI